MVRDSKGRVDVSLMGLEGKRERQGERQGELTIHVGWKGKAGGLGLQSEDNSDH